MAYLVLARRARPQTFDEVVGQRVAVRTLQNALAASRVPHALMFSGVRGVGKTTLARIMAKALNCATGPTPTPCNACPSCRAVADGSSLDLHEIDGASNRGIQEIRELKEGLRFMPASARFKIVIIDEVHMLTSEAFNALLKTLEEPPSHVYFVLATTEPHKVPVTIQSRCQRYELKRVGREELAAHFSRLLGLEGVAMDGAALNLIVRESEGSVRDGLSLLDQVLSYAGASVTVQDVIDVLGVVDRELVFRLLQALLERDAPACLELLEEVFAQGMDFKHFVNTLLETSRALLLCRQCKEPERLLDLPGEEISRLRAMGDDHDVEILQVMQDMLFDGCERAARTQRPRLALELALLRTIQAGALVPVEAILSRLDTLLGEGDDEELLRLRQRFPTPDGESGQAGPGMKSQAAPRENVPASAATDVPAVAEAVPPPPAALPASESTEEGSPAEDAVPQPASGGAGKALPDAGPEEMPAPPPDGPAVSASLSAASEGDAPAESSADPVLVEKKIRQRWDGFIEYVKERKEWMGHVLRRCDSVGLEGAVLVISFQLGADCVLLEERSNLKLLTEFALDYFQENLQVSFRALDENRCTLDGDVGNVPRQQRQKLAQDPLVQLVGEIFQGRIGDIRVGPRFRSQLKADGTALQECAGEGDVA